MNTFPQQVKYLVRFLLAVIVGAASANAQASRFAEDLAAEQVASAAALAFIEDLRAIQGVQDAQTNLDLAQRLSGLAQHQHDTGLATGVDTARGETRVAQDRQRL